ncbi:hypothetical protein cypCar_00020056, partial [Cyprinus carpio]
MDSFVDSLRNCLKITDDSDDCILEEVTVAPFQHVVKSGVEVWESSSQSVRGNADPIPKKKSTCRPSFIEEIVEDIDTSSEIVETAHSSPGPEPRRNERHKALRRLRRQHFDRPLTPQTKVVHY